MNKEDFPFSQPEENAGYLLWQISMIWHRKMNAALRSIDLTFTQFSVLSALGWLLTEHSSVTQLQIAQHVKLDKMTTSKVLKNLVDKGLVIRYENREDTRAKNVELTDEGKPKLKNALDIAGKTDNSLFSLLGEDFEQYKILQQKLFHNLNDL